MTRHDLLAIIATLLAIYLSVSTAHHRYAVEHENGMCKARVAELEKKLADPPKLAREYYRNLRKGKK